MMDKFQGTETHCNILPTSNAFINTSSQLLWLHITPLPNPDTGVKAMETTLKLGRESAFTSGSKQVKQVPRVML